MPYWGGHYCDNWWMGLDVSNEYWNAPNQAPVYAFSPVQAARGLSGDAALLQAGDLPVQRGWRGRAGLCRGGPIAGSLGRRGLWTGGGDAIYALSDSQKVSSGKNCIA